MKPANKSVFHSIITHHLSQYPGLRLEDLYKLVFQAAMGSEHGVIDADQAERRLRIEAETLAPVTGSTPMIDPVSPDQRLVRVNLHPFMTNSGDLGKLSGAFIETSRIFKPSVASLTAFWGWLVEMAGAEDFPFTGGELKDFGRAQREQQYPAVHHSPIYRQQYHPAYRVVLINRIELPVR